MKKHGAGADDDQVEQDLQESETTSVADDADLSGLENYTDYQLGAADELEIDVLNEASILVKDVLFRMTFAYLQKLLGEASSLENMNAIVRAHVAEAYSEYPLAILVNSEGSTSSTAEETDSDTEQEFTQGLRVLFDIVQEAAVSNIMEIITVLLQSDPTRSSSSPSIKVTHPNTTNTLH